MRYIERKQLFEAIALQCGISTAAVRMWDKVPLKRVLDVERATGRPRHLIRPDIYERGDYSMARPANEKNAPSEDDVQAAVSNIEQGHGELLRERGIYMQKCRKIREGIANEYEQAADHGISKKLLKKVVKERELERRIAGLTDDLEPDEINEHQMLLDKLGEFANTPLGSAALQRAEQRSKVKAAAGA